MEEYLFQKWGRARGKNSFDSVSFKLRDPGGSAQEVGGYLLCLVLLHLFPTKSLHHPQWFFTAHQAFLTHIPPNIPASICVHPVFAVNTRALNWHIFKVASMLSRNDQTENYALERPLGEKAGGVFSNIGITKRPGLMER